MNHKDPRPLIFEPEHSDRALEDIYSQFDESDNLLDLIRALCEGIQEFEDLAYDYVTSQFIDLASGYQLDRLGTFVGAQRLGANDDEFRDIIRARVAAQRSGATIGDIGHVLFLLTDAVVLEYTTAYPAGYRFYFVPKEGVLTAGEQRRAARIMELARPAGVAASYVESAGPDADTFRFDVDPGFGRKLGRLLE